MPLKKVLATDDFLRLKTKYTQTLDYLFKQLPMYQRVGSTAFKKDLNNIRAMCELLGQPQEKFLSIHIAGTNGKGSIAHMLAAIFTAGGLKTGLYTSPHYRDFRERVKIDGKLISKKSVVRFVEKNKESFNGINPSFFEWTVAFAFDSFAKEKVDIAIIETGLGGRLDSTNIILPAISIITNIGYDHQQMLGETLSEIAFEKAGIIKNEVPVIIGETNPETESVFRKKAVEENSAIYFADKKITAKETRRNNSHVFYEIKNENKVTWKSLPLEHLAKYQKYNLPTLLLALDIFCNKHPEILKKPQDAIEAGLFGLKEYSAFQGRWEIIGSSPTILCDSAHNTEGIKLAIEGLNDFNYENLHVVLGMVKDKTHYEVLSLFPTNAKYYFAKANIPRGLPAENLREVANGFGLKGKAYTSVRRALAAAKKSAKKEDLIFIGGSIFVVAEVI